MSGVRCHRDGTDWAILGADSAASAVCLDLVFDQSRAFSRGASSLEMRFIFFAEVAQSGEHRVWCGFAQAAQTPGSDLVRQCLEFRKIVLPAFSGAELVENIEHASRADSA